MICWENWECRGYDFSGFFIGAPFVGKVIESNEDYLVKKKTSIWLVMIGKILRGQI